MKGGFMWCCFDMKYKIISNLYFRLQRAMIWIWKSVTLRLRISILRPTLMFLTLTSMSVTSRMSLSRMLPSPMSHVLPSHHTLEYWILNFKMFIIKSSSKQCFMNFFPCTYFHIHSICSCGKCQDPSASDKNCQAPTKFQLLNQSSLPWFLLKTF